jgi:pectate disaccharide-lyase
MHGVWYSIPLILATMLTTHAALFISPSGSDATGNGTIGQPFFTLTKAAGTAAAGDTIFMRGGEYFCDTTVFIDKKGTAAAGFMAIPYQNEKPVFNFSSWKPTDEDVRFYARGIKLSGSYWYIKGLEMCYAPDNGVKLEGHHTTFEQCVFHHNGDGGLQIGLNKEDYDSNPDPEHLAAYNRIINCDAYRNADPATDYENADGFSCKLYAGKDNYFYGCRAWENCDDGWDCYQTNYQITIENCWTWHNGDPSQWGFESFNGDGNGFKLGGDGEPCPITVKNCVAFDTHFGAMSGFNDNNNGMAIIVYNCIAWDCSRDFNMQDQAHVLKNCAAFNNTRMAPKDLSESAVQDHNSWNISTITASAEDFVSIDVEHAQAPRESDGSLPNNGFARLKQGSDLIDKGINVGLPYSGLTPDLGAYEFGLETDVTVRSSHPTFYPQSRSHRFTPGVFDLSGRLLYAGSSSPSSGISIVKKADGMRWTSGTKVMVK